MMTATSTFRSRLCLVVVFLFLVVRFVTINSFVTSKSTTKTRIKSVLAQNNNRLTDDNHYFQHRYDDCRSSRKNSLTSLYVATDMTKDSSKLSSRKRNATTDTVMTSSSKRIINNNNNKSPPATATATLTSGTTSKTFFPPSSSSFSSTTTFSSSTIVTGVVGNWESLHGNWVLRPTNSVEEPPRAVIHFLGGALVGAAPHITYRYMLEKLAQKGFLIVATPYSLSFDHLATCDGILTKFEDLAPTLAREYGALPVVGIGHSCGALLHLLITCLFPDTPRAANALLSFNNKPVSEAVPFFEDFFAPVFTSLAAPTVTRTKDGKTKVDGPSSNDSLIVGLKLAMAATQGELPSDELLEQAQQILLKPPMLGGFPFPIPPVPPFMTTTSSIPFMDVIFGMSTMSSDTGTTTASSRPKIKIPTELRTAYTQWASPTIVTLKDAGVLPIIHEAIITLEQIPKLVDEVAEGARDFNPTPALVRSAAGKAYRARRTLILGYQDDPIDESDEVEEVLREARSITRMRRPMVEIDVQRRTLDGGHEAPLVAPPLDVAERAEDLLGIESSQEVLRYKQAAATVDELVQWLEEGNL